MSKGEIAEKVKTITKEVMKPEEPSKYDVVFLNDELTPMEFVIRVLKQIFNKSQDEAKKITTYIHENGKQLGLRYKKTMHSAESKENK